jgi:hypothetical protein
VHSVVIWICKPDNDDARDDVSKFLLGGSKKHRERQSSVAQETGTANERVDVIVWGFHHFDVLQSIDLSRGFIGGQNLKKSVYSVMSDYRVVMCAISAPNLVESVSSANNVSQSACVFRQSSDHTITY